MHSFYTIEIKYDRKYHTGLTFRDHDKGIYDSIYQVLHTEHILGGWCRTVNSMKIVKLTV